MINPANETFGQARQGSVAAIIQVLNERLADIGIRTRAVVSEGMLQLLCEAATAEQLEKTAVVNRVRTELETISPQHIKKVKINSRIVKEEQLLWLEEINRDPENALLWAEIITLKRPFFIQRWFRDRHLKPAGPIFRDITEPEPKRTSLSTKAFGAGSLALLLLGALWVFRDDLRQVQPVADIPASEPARPAGDLPALPTQPGNSSTAAANGDRTADLTPQTQPPAAAAITQAPTNSAANQSAQASGPTSNNATSNNAAANPATPETTDPAATETTPAASQTTPASQTPSPAATTPATALPNSGAVADAFAEAVRVAGQAAIDGQTATTTAEWLDLAARWQRASDLMGQIPEGSEKYAIATDRVETYKINSQDALTRAAAQE
ncbi:MAG: hypothetical protein AAFP03_04955 [Cyanobacteria bacterium J06598_3]